MNNLTKATTYNLKANPYYSVLLVAAVYLVLLYYLPKETFWISDNGNRFIQTQSIINQQFVKIEILQPNVPPGFSPLQPPHFYKVNDKVFSYYPFAFPYLSALLYSLFGSWGLFFIPVGSSIALLVVFAALCKRTSLTDGCCSPVLILGLCTPIFFYTLTFWEHTLTVLLALLSVYIIAGSKKDSKSLPMLMSGFTAGLIPWFRPEGYVFCLVMSAALLLTRSPRKENIRFLSGCVPAIALLWLVNYIVYGSLFGVHVMKYFQLGELFGTKELSFVQFLKGKMEVLYTYLLQYSENTSKGILLSLPFAIACIAGLSGKRLHTKTAVLILCLTLAGSLLLMIDSFQAKDPVFNTLYTQGMCLCTPFIVFSLLGMRINLSSESDEIRFLTYIAVGFILVVSLIINNYERGILWGSRYFLLVYPFLTIVSVNTYYNMKKSLIPGVWKLALRCLFFIFMVTSLVIQSYGVGLLYRKTIGTQKILEQISASPADYILTDVFWLPEEMASILYKKKFMFIQPSTRMDVLKTVLVQEKVKTVDLVLSPQYSDMSLFPRMRSVFAFKGIHEISDAHMKWMDLYVASYEVK